jgi:AhpD family alkylhydroperoxidase
MIRTMANSPAVLQGYLVMSEALSNGSLSKKLLQLMAITVAEANACQYCLSAHTMIAKALGATEKDIESAQYGKSTDPKTNAALQFARTVVAKRGTVDDADVENVKASGYSDSEIAEMIANISLSIFTNYFNIITKTEVDFPIANFVGEKIE